MWGMYRRRLLAIQILTLIVCAVVYFYFKHGWRHVLAAFLAIEMAGIVGAWWSHRLTSRIESINSNTPLEQRRR
jgi:uncharacterized membrane protein YjjB (DUF3815 family)